MKRETMINRVMTKKVVTVERTDSLLELREILDTKSFHHLVVMDGQKVVGIISANDLSRAIHPFVAVEDGLPLTEFAAEDIMSKDPITVSPDDSLQHAADVILTNRLHALPVVRNGHLEGIITSHDLLKHSYS